MAHVIAKEYGFSVQTGQYDVDPAIVVEVPDREPTCTVTSVERRPSVLSHILKNSFSVISQKQRRFLVLHIIAGCFDDLIDVTIRDNQV